MKHLYIKRVLVKRVLLVLFAALTMVPGWARKKQVTKKVKSLPVAIRNFPSGTIDEYHFRPGNIVVRGCIKNVQTEKNNGTLKFWGRDVFTEKQFVETIEPDSTGHFCTSFMIPHTQFFRLDNSYSIYKEVFAAVGDTLEVVIDGQTGTDHVSVSCGGSGATGEVNRVWPQLYKRFFSSGMTETPWKEHDRQVMLDWKKKKLEEMYVIAMAVDADTVGLLNGCSDFAKDVLKSSLLAFIPQQIGAAFQLYNTADGRQNEPSDRPIHTAETWDFLKPCEAYLLDNPCMLFALKADFFINELKFGPLDAYLYLANDMDTECDDDFSDLLAEYKMDFILPATYNDMDHRQLLDCRNGNLLSVADYYQMATDSIRSRFGFRNNFMMQICLMQEILNNNDEYPEEGYLHVVAERFAAAIPQITDKIVSQRAVEAYRQFVIRREASRTPVASASSEGDSIFNSLVERYKGNVIVMDFWGMSCAPCRKGMLNQRSDVEYFSGKPVRFLYLCNEKSSPREQSEAFMNDNGIRGEHIYLTSDEWNHLSKKFQFIGIPFHIIVDKNGNTVRRKPTRDVIEELLKQ